MAEKWLTTQTKGGEMVLVRPDTPSVGVLIKAAGATVETGSCTPDGNYVVTWGMSLLGSTQPRTSKGHPSDRLKEFVLDRAGAIKYGKAKPKKHTKTKK